MTLFAYLKDRVAVIVVGVFCCVVVGGTLAVLGVGADASILVSCFVAACAALALGVEYLRRRSFYRELEGLIDGLDQAYLVPSLLEEPEFLEGRLARQALAKASRSAADDIAEHRQQARAYREYVELWVHEVKTPIAAAGLMAAGLHGVQAMRLKGELDRIEGYVEQALFYARATSFERDYAIRETPLADAVREACKKNARYLIERGVSPVVQVADDVRVFADAKQLSFIVGQIVTNAAKYGASQVLFSIREEDSRACATRAGEPEAHAVQSKESDACTTRIVFEIADDGCGIPAADVPRVFDRGFTGENGRASESSTGMGLYLVAAMCEKMGLGLGIASEEGTGTRVIFAFPCDRHRLDMLGR